MARNAAEMFVQYPALGTMGTQLMVTLFTVIHACTVFIMWEMSVCNQKLIIIMQIKEVTV